VETFTIEQAADDAAVLLDHLGADRAVVLGHSYGGFIAQELALRHPDRLAGLVLVDTTPGQLGRTEDPGLDQGPRPPREFVDLITDEPSPRWSSWAATTSRRRGSSRSGSPGGFRGP
jgi:pimeloyl-ACP methyl ester carboxylesterase